MVTLSNKALQVICIVLSLVFAVLFFNNLLSTGFDEVIFLTGCLSLCLAFVAHSYRFSDRYQQANSLEVLVQRIDDQLIVQDAQQSPTVKFAPVIIDIERIATMTYGDNYLSLIVDGNGNGYDFRLQCDKVELRSHLNRLFSREEKAKISIESA